MEDLAAQGTEVTEERSPATKAAAPWRVLRTSSILAGVPYHRLSKGGSIKIRLIGKDASGHRVDLRWDVVGDAGPLAYKAHTLLVERRIDELRQQGKLTRLIPLGGGWREAARALDLGGDSVSAKNAVLETAKLDITAEILFINKEGKEEYVKAYDFHPYTILERGTTHEGKTLEQIYFLLHDLIYTIERDGEPRPLNFDYLKALPPAASRFYKFMSSKIYGAIKGSREETKIVYSELCEYLPLKRTNTWQRAQAQLRRVHKPHLGSGYLKRVRYARIRDAQNEQDLEIYYTPGHRAIEEYDFFNGKRTALPPAQARQRVIEESVDTTLLAELTKRGVEERRAREILRTTGGQNVLRQLQYTDQLIAQAPLGKFHNPPGLYVARLSGKAPIPDTFETPDQKEARKDAERLAVRQAGLKEQYGRWSAERTLEMWNTLAMDERDRMLAEAKTEIQSKVGDKGERLFDERWLRLMAERLVRRRFLEQLPSFEEWLEQRSGDHPVAA